MKTKMMQLAKKIFLGVLIFSVILSGVGNYLTSNNSTAHAEETEELGAVIQPLAKYEFQDATNPGKDTMGNYHLEKVGRTDPVLAEGETAKIDVSNGVATFDGTAGLVATQKANDIGGALQSFTLAFQIKASEMQNDEWVKAIGFGWNDYSPTKFVNFQIAATGVANDLMFVTNADGATDPYWGLANANQVLGALSGDSFSTIILSAQLGGKMAVYVDGALRYSFDLPTDFSLKDEGMRFAMGGLGLFGNMYQTFKGSLSDVRIYDFAFNEAQITQYTDKKDVYEAKVDLGEVINPLAKYEFQDATNPGKDTMGNYHLETKIHCEKATGNVTASNGVASFDGGAALVARSEENDISEDLESFTVAFNIKNATPEAGWHTLVGFGWNDWIPTKWGNFHYGDDSNLRFGTHLVSDETASPYWGQVIGNFSGSLDSTVILSAQLGGKITIYVDGELKYSYDLPAEYSLKDTNMRFAIGGSCIWGNVYETFTGSLSDVRVYDFAFNETQVNRYMTSGDVYKEKVVQQYTAEQFATYRAGGAGNYIAPTAPEGYVFAGWFSDNTCETALTSNTIASNSFAYAKYVDASILSVKCQIPANATMNDLETTLRLVTTVDSLDYSMAGFEVSVAGGTSTLYTTRKAYDNIKATVSGTSITYMPYEFSVEAGYFMALEITGVPRSIFGETITVIPAWKTLDGTIVRATENCRNDIIIANAILGSTKFTAISYENISTVSDINAYHSEVNKENGKHNDDPVENGVVNCPYYTLKINEVNVPVYSTRCHESVHSFAWIDIDEAETDIELNVEIALENNHEQVVVLPQSSGVTPNMEDGVVTAKITSLGSYSFAFDDGVEEALTIYVAKEEKLDIPNNYVVKKFSPGTYQAVNTNFTAQNAVYYFKKGVYNISSISLPSNSILYFESGTYVNVIPESAEDSLSAIRSVNSENIEICGRALFDFSQCQGGDSKVKGVYTFINVNTARYTGITTINSNNWSLVFANSNDVLVENNMLLGYRTYSDGILLSDCQYSLVRNNFVRTGDDAIEVKSTGGEGAENLIFEYNAVWTDKARGYGCIYECEDTVKNIVFRNNSIGFALPTWSDILACLTVNMGSNRATTWEDIHFENIEIYKAENALINIYLKDTLGTGVGDNGTGTGGGQAKNLYFKNIHAYQSNGLAVNVYVDSASSLENVYLDNINYNGIKLKQEDIELSEDVLINHYDSSWSPSLNIKVDSLTEE